MGNESVKFQPTSEMVSSGGVFGTNSETVNTGSVNKSTNIAPASVMAAAGIDYNSSSATENSLVDCSFIDNTELQSLMEQKISLQSDKEASEEELRSIANGTTEELTSLNGEVESAWNAYQQALNEDAQNNEELQSLQTQQAENKTSLEENAQNIILSQRQIDNYENEISSTKTNLDNLNSELSTLQKQLKNTEENSDEYRQIQALINVKNEQITEANDELTSLNENLQDAKDHLEELEDTKSELEKTSKTLQNDIKDLCSDTTKTLLKAYNNAKEEYENTQSDAQKTCQKEIDDYQKEINKIDNQITKQKNQEYKDGNYNVDEQQTMECLVNNGNWDYESIVSDSIDVSTGEDVEASAVAQFNGETEFIEDGETASFPKKSNEEKFIAIDNAAQLAAIYESKGWIDDTASSTTLDDGTIQYKDKNGNLLYEFKMSDDGKEAYSVSYSRDGKVYEYTKIAVNSTGEANLYDTRIESDGTAHKSINQIYV